MATAFGLTYDIPTLLAHSSLHACVLVLDGFEHLEGEARHRAIQLMGSLKDQDITGWKLIITCQPQFWGSVQDVLVQTGINDFLKLDIGKPAPAEVLGAVRHLSAIRGLLLRTDLQPFPLASEDGTTIKSPVPELLKRVAKIDTRSEASVMHGD